MTEPVNLEKQQWNYAASLAALVIIGVNIVLGWAFLAGNLDVKDWAAFTGPINGGVLGWVGRAMGVK